jgi:hypothetical protein
MPYKAHTDYSLFHQTLHTRAKPKQMFVQAYVSICLKLYIGASMCCPLEDFDKHRNTRNDAMASFLLRSIDGQSFCQSHEAQLVAR